MKKILPALLMLVNLLVFQPSFAAKEAYDVKKTDIFEGYVVKKIWLTAYAVPQVALSEITYTANVALPKDAKLSDPNKFIVTIGMERKRPFVVVRIPAFVSGSEAGVVNQVAGFSLSINEQPAAPNKLAARTTDVTTSVLATGTWYKIGITKTGFYKIDYNFLTAMGQKPANIDPANIRICGNGGNMLSENNAVSRPTDLLENAVLVNGNGDNVFDNGESVVFYAVGTVAWNKDSADQRFTHQNNLYTDTAYYFISFNSGPGTHIATQASVPSGNVNVTSFNYYASHELDLVNPAEIGKLWYGETFSPQLNNTTQSFSFDIGATISSAWCTVGFASTSDIAGCSFNVAMNGSNVGSSSFGTPTTGDNDMNIGYESGSAACNSSVANVTVTFNAADQSSLGYLYYIELNARPPLIMTGDQMNFRDWQSVGTGNVANFQLQGANSSTQVWDVTYPQAPVIMNGSLSGSTYSFTQDAAMLHEYAAMNSSNLYTPNYIGTVPNQNLHNLSPVDMIIVTNPAFQNQANQLAAYHQQHDNLKVIVATTDQVYNEFSSGGQDISGIRDFARMFYKRATDSTQLPRYILLFGGASYDYKNRLPGNTDFVPVFESAESSDDLNCFCTDDFYGFLDDNEYIENDNIVNTLDIGVGRLPARNQNDATAMVNKIINYTSPASLGPWRVSTTVVADKGCLGPGLGFDPAGDHMDDAEIMAGTLATVGNNLYNEGKIYVDAIPLVATPAGERCPNANAALDQQVFNGTFQINYNGHGNPTVWSSERILTQDDFNSWNNLNMLPFMVTATCDFGQFDHSQFVSAAEQMVVGSTGGVIAVLTTTEAVYASYNVELNQQFLDAQYTRNPGGSWNAFGDASRIGKNVTYLTSKDPGEIANFRKFSLLGDPALTPDFPQYNVQLDSVIDGYTLQPADTIKALGAYIIDGSVHDNNGNVMTGFNGTVYVSFFDKPRDITTISGCNEVYQLQDNLVYKGRVTVTNGRFSFTFITPKDINYLFGSGKVSTYANTSIIDAAGEDTTIAVGGFSDHPVLNTDPPIVKPYINDSLFLNGGITGSNTSLFVTFYTKTGINVSGNDIGHDLTAVLDGVSDAPYILNDYYESAPNTYQYGYVSFPISGLADGPHSIKVRAWDVNNNVGEGTVNFVVVDGQVMDIQQLGNYPNPFNNTTHFVFEHNHPFEQLDVQIEIYSISGALVKKIQQDLTPTDSRTAEITWDGTDNSGDRLPSGVYVYRLNISTESGYKSSAYQKLVIVR